MKAFRMSILLAVLMVSMPACKESPKKLKERFLGDLVELVHKIEQRSVHFTSDKDWNTYDTLYHDLVELEYLQHADYMAPIEHQQVAALKARYSAAKTNYIRRRIEEKVNNWSHAVKEFLTQP